MADANIMTPARQLQIVTTGTTAVPAAYAALVPTSNAPANTSSDTVQVITPPGPANGIVFMPFSASTAQTGVGVRVIGWNTFTATTPKAAVWYNPQILATFSLTITTAVTKPTYTIEGETVAPFAVGAITASLLTNVTPRVYGTESAGTYPLWLGVDTAGCQFISLQFQANTTAEMGALLRWV